ncbi:MAG: hypothetical protein ACK4ZY_13390 [Sphingomonas sp.]
MTRRSTWLKTGLILSAVALALRLSDIGNPLVDIDEQMYLLVGQRMWDGAIPYVDIWDRKPIGLFLIYAASQLLPGDPIVAYHLVALAAATATAGLIAHFVRRLGSPAGALPAGMVYLVWLELAGGRGGQSPVFYTLLVVAAAMLTWQTLYEQRRHGTAAMLLIGVALQIKPTCVFEGALLGAALLLASWRRHRTVMRVVADALLYATAALAPTAAAGLAYGAIGYADAWWFANVQSIFLRRVTDGQPIADRLLGSLIVLSVPTVVAIRGVWSRRCVFVASWLAAAIAGWLLVPPYFNHYALPLLAPLAVAAGLALDRAAMRVLAAAAGVGLLLLSGYPHWGEAGDTRRRLAALAATIDRIDKGGCPFVFRAPPALYTARHACLPTRFPFPPHLVELSESGAIGIDPVGEVTRILAAAPPVIVVGPAGRDDDPRTVRLVARAVATRYRPIARDLGVTVYARDN